MSDYEPTEEDVAEQIAERIKRQRLMAPMVADAQRAEFRAILADERVRDVMWRILDRCHIYRTSFDKNYGDMARKEGERNIGLWLLAAICDADPRAETAMREKAVHLAALAQAERDAAEAQKKAKRR